MVRSNSFGHIDSVKWITLNSKANFTILFYKQFDSWDPLNKPSTKTQKNN